MFSHRQCLCVFQPPLFRSTNVAYSGSEVAQQSLTPPIMGPANQSAAGSGTETDVLTGRLIGTTSTAEGNVTTIGTASIETELAADAAAAAAMMPTALAKL